MEQEESGKKQRTVKNETSMVLTGLEGNSLYLITVRGFNSIGQGPATAAVAAKTRKAREYSTDTKSCNTIYGIEATCKVCSKSPCKKCSN